ncbi:MAG: hypothetical protein BAJALOKI1v1_1690003 [Promethearchaeota archaeon]|nr:MAG: hypothetical protein BAJALOKI1v1_1690003 [Candidatus Lokiarchaeota archaeon]
MLKNAEINPKELEFIQIVEDLVHTRCKVKDSIDWRSDTIGASKQTNPRFNVVIEDQKISKFAIAGARLTEFPEFKGIFDHLKSFYIIKCSLEDVPKSLLSLKNLTHLDLSYNDLNDIPNSIEKLSNLVEINLSHNSLLTIPKGILTLLYKGSLKKISIKANPIDFIPQNYPNLDKIISSYQKEALNKAEAEVLAHLELITGEKIHRVHHRGILNGYYLQNKTITWLRLFSPNLKTLPKNIANLKNLKTLNLAGEPPQEEQGFAGRRSGLQSLPSTIGSLLNLRWLYLSKSMLESVPKELGNLTNLQQLYLSDNLLEELPDSLKNLDSLQYFYIQKNRLKEIPKWISNLSHLQKLDLSHNRIIRIPEEFSNLRDLTTLSLEYNFIQELPKSISTLPNLLHMKLSNNTLTSESLDALYDLTTLISLDISYNSDISYLAENVGNLTHLELLDLEGNQFISIPTSIWRLKQLKQLNLANNPWSEEDQELVHRDLEYILEYCRRKANIHVFFSHAVEDFEKHNLIEIITFLEAQPEIYEVMYCERDLTGNIDQFMRDNVPKSNLLLFFATKKSVFDSIDCKTELELARENDIEIIPIKTAEVNWEDLSKVGLNRELGREFNQNLDIFKEELYDYLKKFKRNINLFEKDRAKIDKVKFTLQNELIRILNSPKAEEYIQNNYDTIMEEISKNKTTNKKYKAKVLNAFKKLMELDES